MCPVGGTLTISECERTTIVGGRPLVIAEREKADASRSPRAVRLAGLAATGVLADYPQCNPFLIRRDWFR